MISTVLFAVLLSHFGSGTSLYDATPEEMFNEAITNINKYNADNNFQNLQFNDSNVESVFYDLRTSKVLLGDLSTIQLKAQTQPSITSMVSTLGKTYNFKATLELKKGFAQYYYLLKYFLIFSSSGTVTATAKHSFEVEGNVKIDSLKHCQADVSTITVKLGNFHATLTPGGIFHFILKPFIQYFTNSYSQDIIPIEAQIADYIQTSIPKSKFSELVCNAFNK